MTWDHLNTKLVRYSDPHCSTQSNWCNAWATYLYHYAPGFKGWHYRKDTLPLSPKKGEFGFKKPISLLLSLMSISSYVVLKKLVTCINLPGKWNALLVLDVKEWIIWFDTDWKTSCRKCYKMFKENSPKKHFCYETAIKPILMLTLQSF